jgi:hypothetical protein
MHDSTRGPRDRNAPANTQSPAAPGAAAACTRMENYQHDIVRKPYDDIIDLDIYGCHHPVPASKRTQTLATASPS